MACRRCCCEPGFSPISHQGDLGQTICCPQIEDIDNDAITCADVTTNLNELFLAVQRVANLIDEAVMWAVLSPTAVRLLLLAEGSADRHQGLAAALQRRPPARLARLSRICSREVRAPRLARPPLASEEA